MLRWWRWLGSGCFLVFYYVKYQDPAVYWLLGGMVWVIYVVDRIRDVQNGDSSFGSDTTSCGSIGAVLTIVAGSGLCQLRGGLLPRGACGHCLGLAEGVPLSAWRLLPSARFLPMERLVVFFVACFFVVGHRQGRRDGFSAVSRICLAALDVSPLAPQWEPTFIPLKGSLGWCFLSKRSDSPFSV